MKKSPLIAAALRILFLATIAVAAPAHAASITWGPRTGIFTDTDVSVGGTLVGAFNVGTTGVAGTTINGVNFQPFAIPGGSTGATVGNYQISSSTLLNPTNTGTGSSNPPFSALSSQYQALLASAVANVGGSFTLTISGLTVGAQYLFQWWANNSDTDPNSGHTATAGNSVTLFHNTTPGSPSGGIGEFALGFFTADAPTQTITFSGEAYALLNGFQLRQLRSAPTVPDSGSTLLFLALGKFWLPYQGSASPGSSGALI
jgi:hypothetical protein